MRTPWLEIYCEIINEIRVVLIGEESGREVWCAVS